MTEAALENRVAFVGKIDLVHGVYQDAAIAVLDKRAFAGPFIGLFQKIAPTPETTPINALSTIQRPLRGKC